MEQGKVAFKISEIKQAEAKDLTYLLISKLHGWNNGTDRAHLFDDFGLSPDQYNLIFDMFLTYLLVYPEMNSFQTALWQVENKQQLIDAVDLFKDYNLLPETLNKQEERLDIKLKHIEAIKLANRAKEIERLKKIDEKFDVFNNRLNNPIPHEQTTAAYTISESSNIQEDDIAF